MSGTLSESTHFFAHAMAADGFVVECGRGRQGDIEREWFVIISRDPEFVDGLRKISPTSWPGRPSSPVKDCFVSKPMDEAAVRSGLMNAGLTDTDIDAKLEWARRFVTTITSSRGPAPAPWRLIVPEKG
jgi:hypothetical protein